jgi:organic hydroperoxide reductase OsmC/OhrA
VTVTAYEDHVEGLMHEEPDGSGQFVHAVLRPCVRILPECDASLAASLHQRAHAMCFIARSVSFPIHCEPSVSIDHSIPE